MVSVLSVWQVFPCSLRWFHVVYSLHSVLGTTRVSSWSTAFILYSADLVDIADKHGVTMITLSQMTRSFICIVSAMIPHESLLDWSIALQISTTGCRPID